MTNEELRQSLADWLSRGSPDPAFNLICHRLLEAVEHIEELRQALQDVEEMLPEEMEHPHWTPGQGLNERDWEILQESRAVLKKRLAWEITETKGGGNHGESLDRNI